MKKPLRALVIEDSEFDAAILVGLLRHGGYDVTWRRVDTAAAMREALATQTWDFVFSDHEMPEFSAPAALEILQETRLDLPFIIVSGGIGEATAVAAMKAGAHDFLMKGQLGRLVPAVERELREAANRAARREAERSLRESELRYRLLWENSPDAVVLMDDEGRIQFANPAVEKVFGYQPQELVGQDFLVLRCEQAGKIASGPRTTEWEAARVQTRGAMVETAGRRKTGEAVVIEISFSDMYMEGKGWFLAFIRDVTERKRTEQALRETQEQFLVAREIQQQLFPKAAPSLPGFDISGASYPAEATGGDFFDYMPMLHDGLALVVGDVTGHGIGPALLMAETRAYLRIVALNRDHVSEVVTRANRALAEDVGQERFVTALVVRLDAAQRQLTYANAGHPAGYVVGSDGRVRHKLTRSGVPMGINLDIVYPESPGIGLQPGDIVLMLTDGYEETMAPDSSFFGVERAIEVVHRHRDHPARAIVEALHAAATAFAQGTPQVDDLTAVVVKVLP